MWDDHGMPAWMQPYGRSFVFSALLALAFVSAGCKQTPRTRQLSLREVMAADVDPDQRGQRVKVSGVVTYSDPEWHLLFLQDREGGTYVEPPLNSELRAGDQVQITGTTTLPGKLLEKPEFLVLNHGQVPSPLALANASQFQAYPSQLVQTVGIVRWSGIRNGRATIEAYAGDARLQAILFPATSEDLPRIASEIKIAGVSSALYDSEGRFSGPQLLTPSPRLVQVLKSGPQDPFTLALTQVSELHQAKPGTLVHLAGRALDRATSLLLVEGADSVAVNLRRPLHGDFASAEVAGFWNGSAIEDAMLRSTGELLPHAGDIRSLGELKHLSVAEAASGRRVSIRGVVTYRDSDWGLLFVQDPSGAAFVNTRGLDLRLRAGDMVDISGLSGPGDYAPVIIEPAVSFVGHGVFPPPLRLDPWQGNLATTDSHWSNFSGVVHSVQFVDGHTNLKLGAGPMALNLQLPTLINGEQLLDKEVSATGALGILFNERRQAVGRQIFVPAPEFLTVVGTGGRPNPESTVAMLRRYSRDFDENHSVGLVGHVVLKTGPNTIFVQDRTAGIQVRTSAALDVNTGDRVRVRGFLRPGDYSPALEDAVVERQGAGPLPEPETISPQSAAEGLLDSEYVSMHGVLASVRLAPNGTTLVLKDGATYFDALGPPSHELSTLRLGSVLEVHGVCQVTIDRSQVPFSISGFTLAFDSPGSVRVLKLGPWWDPGRVRWALILIAAAAAAAALWATMLRRKVLTRTRELQSSLAAKRRAQQFDGARNEVLESIARNAPLRASMETLAVAIQDQIPDTLCAVLMPADGKSFLNRKPAPVLIAPGLPEAVRHSDALVSALQECVQADETRIVEADSELASKLLAVLHQAGIPFTSANSSLVFSAAGTVAGILLLFSTQEIEIPNGSVRGNALLSASRLIALACDHWQMHARLLHEARHDGLTGLPNRTVAEDRLEQALARADRRKKSFAVFCIDLDGFKAVNDQLGHDTGDEMLKAVAVRLRGRIRHSDTLARIGGDEFLAIIEDCANDSAAQSVANSLIAALQEPVTVEERMLTLSASIGIAVYPRDGKNASQLKRNADQAMYRAKNNGGGQCRSWSSVELSTKAATAQ
jgi:diguanylate cyclase (GGDEF)-like protein